MWKHQLFWVLREIRDEWHFFRAEYFSWKEEK